MIELLRDEMGFRVLIVSDDMDLKAIDQSRESWCETIVASIVAGADRVCRELERYIWAPEAIAKDAGKNKVMASQQGCS